MGKRSQIKSDEVIGSDSDAEDSPASASPLPKKAKKEKKEAKAELEASTSTAKESGAMLTDAEGASYLPLNKMKRVTVRSYKKMTLIDIREFYSDKSSGEEKPGKKGISLSPADWDLLKEHMADIDEAISKM